MPKNSNHVKCGNSQYSSPSINRLTVKPLIKLSVVSNIDYLCLITLYLTLSSILVDRKMYP